MTILEDRLAVALRNLMETLPKSVIPEQAMKTLQDYDQQNETPWETIIRRGLMYADEGHQLLGLKLMENIAVGLILQSYPVTVDDKLVENVAKMVQETKYGSIVGNDEARRIIAFIVGYFVRNGALKLKEQKHDA